MGVRSVLDDLGSFKVHPYSLCPTSNTLRHNCNLNTRLDGHVELSMGFCYSTLLAR